MTTWSNNFNGIADGTTVTTANSGGTSGTAFNATQVPTGGSLTAAAAAAQEGATGLQIVFPSTSQAGYVFWTLSGTPVGTRLSLSMWYRMSALPPSGVFSRVFDMSALLVSLNSSGQFVLGPTATPFVTSTATSAGTWVFIQYAATANASTTAGRIECVITTAGGATLLSYDSGAAINAGTVSYASLYVGRSAAVASAMTSSYDLVNVSNVLTSGFPGAGAPTVITLTNTTVPTITGTPQVGQTLTASNGTWSATPDSFAYQWKRAGAAISGATTSTYVVTSSDIGSTLTVTVTATKAGYTTASATSAPTATVTGAGNIKVWNGSSFVAKPVKVWNGSAWVVKPVNRWAGSAWVKTSY